MSRWTDARPRRSASSRGTGATALRNVPEHAGDLRQPLPALPRPARRADPRQPRRARRALLEQQTGTRWRLAGAEQVGFRHFVQPGDQMELTVKLKELARRRGRRCSGEVTVDGKVVTTRAHSCALVPRVRQSDA